MPALACLVVWPRSLDESRAELFWLLLGSWSSQLTDIQWAHVQLEAFSKVQNFRFEARLGNSFVWEDLNWYNLLLSGRK